MDTSTKVEARLRPMAKVRARFFMGFCFVLVYTMNSVLRSKNLPVFVHQSSGDNRYHCGHGVDCEERVGDQLHHPQLQPEDHPFHTVYNELRSSQ